MIYSNYYPEMFKSARQRKREEQAAQAGSFGSGRVKTGVPAPSPQPDKEPVAIEDVKLDEELVPGDDLVDVVSVGELAQSLADEYTVAELKQTAEELSIDVPSRIKELELATLIAEKQLTKIGG